MLLRHVARSVAIQLVASVSWAFGRELLDRPFSLSIMLGAAAVAFGFVNALGRMGARNRLDRRLLAGGAALCMTLFGLCVWAYGGVWWRTAIGIVAHAMLPIGISLLIRERKRYLAERDAAPTVSAPTVA
jgi:hypothetical protein